MANIDIGGRLHSTATGNVVAGANEILDDSKGKKQSVINAEVDEALTGKQATIDDLSTIRSGAAAGATAYQKPGTGIPSTDMASGVQASLGKADSAYQKPSGGIPKTDLDSGVQASLDLADSAVQADPVGSVTPPVDPSAWATAEEVDELELKVDDIEDTMQDADNYAETKSGWLSSTDGQVSVLHPEYSHCDTYFPITADPSVASTGTATPVKRFYDSSKTYLGASYSASAAYLRLTYILNAGVSPRDVTLTVDGVTYTGKPYKKLAAEEDLTDVKDTQDGLLADLEYVTPTNLLNRSALSNGFITKAGVVGSGDYKYTAHIPVTPGRVVSCWTYLNGLWTATNMRFLTAYNSEDVVVSDAGSDSNITSYTTPANIASIIVSFSDSVLTNPVMICYGATHPVSWSEYFAPHYSGKMNFMPEQILRLYKNGYASSKRASIGASANINLPQMTLCKNLVYSFYAKVVNFGDGIDIGCGTTNDYGYSFINITPTQVNWNINGSVLSSDHGLTIGDYIAVELVIDDNTKGHLTIFAGGSEYTRTLGFYGFSNTPYRFTTKANVSLEDVVFTISCKDFKDAKTYLFGDSYVAIVESSSKWSHWLVSRGYSDNFLLSALPGQNGANALISLQNILSIGTPQAIIWAMGMNDGADTDSSTPNATWLSNVNTLLAKCAESDIEPIFCTIPSVPSILNEGKNSWVRSSGYRYIDVAKAVGANSSGVWYSGMLSTDNVHPTELGAKAIAYRVISDFPDITM